MSHQAFQAEILILQTVSLGDLKKPMKDQISYFLQCKVAAIPNSEAQQLFRLIRLFWCYIKRKF
jgi:hypothetical protein